MLSNRENILNYYNHKPMDHFTTYYEALDISWQCSGFHERPANHQSGLDWFGVYWVYNEQGDDFIPDHRQKPVLEDICDWREVVQWPDLDAMDWKQAAIIDGAAQKDKVDKAYIMLLGMGPFERLHTLMGFEGALMAMVSEQDECKAFFEKWTEWKCKLISYIIDYYKPDVMQFHDDSGTRQSSFYSPETWRELIKPCWTACCTEIKSHGIPAELHSCGKGQEFFKEIEDCGFDSLFIQSINDFQYIRQFTGGRVGIVPTDYTWEMEMKMAKGGISVKEVRDTTYEFVKKNIEDSVNGYDFMMFAAPIPEAEGITEDTILRTQFEIYASAWTGIMMHLAELNETLQKKNAEWAAKCC